MHIPRDMIVGFPPPTLVTLFSPFAFFVSYVCELLVLCKHIIERPGRDRRKNRDAKVRNGRRMQTLMMKEK